MINQFMKIEYLNYAIKEEKMSLVLSVFVLKHLICLGFAIFW